MAEDFATKIHGMHPGSIHVEELQQDSCTETDDETQFSTSVSTSPDDAVGGTGDGTAAHNPNNPNNVALLPSRILMALSLMLILHAMIANL